MERRELAESALKHLCDRIGVRYGSESEYNDGDWFIESISRNRVNIARWAEGSHTGGRSLNHPLGNYGQNLTHEEVYDRCWFADRCMTAHVTALIEQHPNTRQRA